jgi:hypothetical protein
MEKTNKIIGTLIVLISVVLLVGLASAEFVITNTTAFPVNVSHGNSYNVSFLVNNTFGYNVSNINISGNSSVGTWSSSVISFLNATGSTASSTVQLTLSIPSHTQSTTITPIITASNGTITNSTTFSNILLIESPSLSFPTSSQLTIDESINQTTITVTNNGNTNLNDVVLTIVNGTYFGFNVLNSSLGINAGQSKAFTVDVDSLTSSSTRIGSFSHTINATATGASTTGTLTIEKTYCRSGEQTQNNLIKIVEIEDRSSGDDWEWEPLKDIKIRVEVENNDESRKSVTVKMGLYDVDRNRFIDLSTEDRELDQTERIDDGDYQRFDFEFTLPANIDIDGDYRLYVKAYERGKEDTLCTSDFGDDYYQTIYIEADEEIVADEFVIPSFLFCGETNTISFKLYNIDLGDEELMRVQMYNQELGINVYTEQFELDNGENREIFFEFTVPEGIEAKTYRFNFYADYDYRESTSLYRKSGTLATYTLMVDGTKCKEPIPPTIGAALDSETVTMVGEDLVLEVTIKNTLNATTTFVVALDQYDSWASSASVTPSSIVLQAGETGNVTATLKPKKSGEQEFVVQAVYNGKVIERTIKVEIEGTEGFFSRFSLPSLAIGENPVYYLTIGIFVVLILIILILLVRFANKKE